MSVAPTPTATFRALSDFVVNCPDLTRLEELIGEFNVFSVLGLEFGELSHTRMLAWILNPAESHGLGDSFLKRWLMRVAHEAAPTEWSAIDVECWKVSRSEVRREWQHIDLLVTLTMAQGERWILCIENKVHSHQHSEQLARYRRIIETHFGTATRRIFVFLTKHEEKPHDLAFVSASYSQVHRALSEAIAIRSLSVGAEPRVLLDSYLRLLREKFMNESEIARLAIRIHQQHQHALNVIMAHNPAWFRGMLRQKIVEKLTQKSGELSIIVEALTDELIYFTPKEWDISSNNTANSFSGNRRHVLCQLRLLPHETCFCVASGLSPEAWIGEVVTETALLPFFKNPGLWDPGWLWLHRIDNDKLRFDDDSLTDPVEMADEVVSWVTAIFRGTDTRNVIDTVATKLGQLPAAVVAS